jgi:tetratricopeptide (TPR) repeat protein
MIRLLFLSLLLGLSAHADDLQLAREHYSRAIKAYEVGQYDEAIAEFAAAYKLRDDPSILFNLAQSHRLAGHRAEALRTYRMFMLKVPNAPNRHEVEAMITNLQSSSGKEDPDRELARRYSEAGAAKFAAGEFQEAVAEFEKARLVKPSPGLDLNIARCYDKLGRLEEALASYRLYVEAKPDAPDSAEIRNRITTLDERLTASRPPTPAAEPQPPPQPQPQQPKPDVHAGRTLTAAGIAIAVVGVAALAGGIASGVLAKQNGDDLTQADQNMGTFSAAKESAGKSEQIAEGVLLGVGGAAVVTGVVLVIVGQRARHHAVALVPSLAPGSAGAVLSGSF